MPRPCSICVRDDRDLIDAAIVANVPNRRVASQYGVTEAAVRRHRASHLPETLTKAAEAAEELRADSLLDQIRDLQQRTMRILEQAESAKDLKTALSAIREARGNLELLTKATGGSDEAESVRSAVFKWVPPEPQSSSAE